MGDIGYLDNEGYLYVSDRRTDLVLSGGVNIYPAEIERALIGMPGSPIAQFLVCLMPNSGNRLLLRYRPTTRDL